MNTDRLLSIIVPVYNVEKFVGKCLESILNQYYSNIEVIVVDDGATDSSGEICDRIAELDSRVKVLHTTNNGLSEARNLGMSLAKGYYIAFVDSDDYIERDMYTVLINDIEKYDVDVAISDIYKEDNHINTEDVEIYSGNEMLERLYAKDYWKNVVVWNKVYKRTLWEGIKFPKGKTREDEHVAHKWMYNANKVSIRKQGFYHYVLHGDSITHKKTLSVVDRLEATEDRLLFCEEKGLERIYYLTLCRLLNDSMRCYVYCRKNFDQRDVERRTANRFIKYYPRTKEMIRFFNSNGDKPNKYLIKVLLIYVFAFYCKFSV